MTALADRALAYAHTQQIDLTGIVSCQSIAQAFDLKGVAATRRWQQIAESVFSRVHPD